MNNDARYTLLKLVNFMKNNSKGITDICLTYLISVFLNDVREELLLDQNYF